MSDSDRSLHDPIIDPVEECENDEPSSPRPVEHHTDNGHIIGSYNGDSFTVSGSPFKKSYGTSSLGEASMDSLVDEPLPIESVALSPFRMDTIHNSPLSSRQKDSYTFSVSVSDSLPSHVMELDSPEHYGDRMDEPYEFCVDKIPPPMKMSEEEEEFLIRPRSSSDVVQAQSETMDTLESILSPSQDFQRQRENEPWQEAQITSIKSDAQRISSQEDMFESQEVIAENPPLPILKGDFSKKETKHVMFSEDLPIQKESSTGGLSEDILMDDDFIPPSESPSYSKSPLNPFKADLTKAGGHSPSPADSPSQSKRKRDESSEEEKSFEVAVKKDRKEDSEDFDSDIEIIETGSFSSANQSVEVVYDKKVRDSEAVESQDLKLILTGDTQSDCDRFTVSSSVKEKDSSQSQSLLSMPDSVNLSCNEHISSSSYDVCSQVESTIGPTQLEMLCKPAAHHASQPNIEPLITLPIVQEKVTSNGSNESTNNISNSSSSNNNNNNSSVEEKEVDTSIASSVQPELSPTESTPESQGIESGVSFPHFDTPQITQQSQQVEEVEESVFVKAVKAAEKKTEKEKTIESSKAIEKDSFDTFPLLLDDANSSKVSPSDNRNEDSNNSTPICAINPTRSSQSTPISSQPMEPSNRWLFSKFSQGNSSLSDQDSSQKPNVSAGDSDEEGEKRKQGNPKKKITSSTPNVSDKSVSPEIMKDEQSNITKDSKVNSTINSSLNPTHLESSKNDTQPMESDTIHSVQDLSEGGWIKFGQRTITFEVWESPIGKESIYRIVGTNEIIKENTPFSNVAQLANSVKSDSSKEGRISDISSISRSTCSSSGYLGDKSSSSSSRHESTRLSMASVVTISPPHSTKISVDSHFKRVDDEILFRLPPPKSSVSHFPQKVVDVESHESKSIFLYSGLSSDTSSDQVIPKSRGRPRGRGRGRGRGRAGEKRVIIPPVIKEDDNKGDDNDSHPIPVPKEDDKDKFYSLLPDFLQEKLRNAQIPLTEDEEEIFILQKNQINKNDQKTQFEEVLRRVRMAEIRPDVLVFARYFDKNYYSAIIQEEAKEDRWTVKYNLDGLVNNVREVYILPTELLPKGTACHVRHPEQPFSDPGIVKSHMYQNGVLIHIIELHKGQVVKAPHSHIILSPDVATALNESRLSFRSMIASPGGDVSLDNIVPGKRRRETSSSPQKRLQMGYTPSPRPRKADLHLDTSESSTDTKKKTPKSEARKIPTAVSESSMSDGEGQPMYSDTPKYSRKKVTKKTPSKSTPKIKTTKKQQADEPEEVDKALEETPKDSLKKSRKKETTSKKKQKLVTEEEESPKKSNKQLFQHSEAIPKTPSGKSDQKTLGGKLPNLKTLSKSAGSKTPLKSKESLLNPVVELIQLDDVSASPKSSPKSGPKKRGRRPGSATKHPKKFLKMDQDDPSIREDEEEEEEIDNRLGPLPRSGCKIFEGYSILITHAGNQKYQNTEDGEKFLPMNRDHLIEQICSAGGRVMETFDEAYKEHAHSLQNRKAPLKDDNVSLQLHKKQTMPAKDSPSRVLCLSNSYCRTEKYIQCLTVGIPLVNMNWIISSVTQNSCLNWLKFILPAGLSLITGNLLEQPFGDAFKDTASTVGEVVEVLKGEKVFLATSSNPKFGELWLNLLTVAKADVFKMPPQGGNIQRLIDRRTAVVIADFSIPEVEVKRATEAKVPIVSSEWFIQSLLARCKLPFDAQPEFKYNHKTNNKNTQDDETGR